MNILISLCAYTLGVLLHEIMTKIVMRLVVVEHIKIEREREGGRENSMTIKRSTLYYLASTNFN